MRLWYALFSSPVGSFAAISTGGEDNFKVPTIYRKLAFMKVLCKELGFIELLCKEQIIIQFIFLNQFFFFFFF